jgi:hypothetical protein
MTLSEKQRVCLHIFSERQSLDNPWTVLGQSLKNKNEGINKKQPKNIHIIKF